MRISENWQREERVLADVAERGDVPEENSGLADFDRVDSGLEDFDQADFDPVDSGLLDFVPAYFVPADFDPVGFVLTENPSVVL